MRILFLTLVFSLISHSSSASGGRYDFLVEQYKNNNFFEVTPNTNPDGRPTSFSVSDSEIVNHANGFIDGAEYVAIVARQTSPDAQDGPLILIFRKSGNEFAVIARIDLNGDYANGYSTAIKNNSIYLENMVGHHGWHGVRYQFNRLGNKFRLVGAESRSEALGCYAGDESPRCDQYEAWTGTSYNFLTSSAICWRVSWHDKRELKKEGSRKDYWQHPRDGSHHRMSFQTLKLPLLDAFSFDYSLPHTCYFDHENTLRLERPEP